jgi:hypothetical protein
MGGVGPNSHQAVEVGLVAMAAILKMTAQN